MFLAADNIEQAERAAVQRGELHSLEYRPLVPGRLVPEGLLSELRSCSGDSRRPLCAIHVAADMWTRKDRPKRMGTEENLWSFSESI